MRAFTVMTVVLLALAAANFALGHVAVGCSMVAVAIGCHLQRNRRRH